MLFYSFVRIFVVRIWQIRNETPKTDPSLKEQRLFSDIVGIPSYIVDKSASKREKSQTRLNYFERELARPTGQGRKKGVA